jgi:hypothetical protein
MRRVGKAWEPCDADDPGVLDLGRLMRECVWNHEEKRFEVHRKKSRRPAAD